MQAHDQALSRNKKLPVVALSAGGPVFAAGVRAAWPVRVLRCCTITSRGGSSHTTAGVQSSAVDAVSDLCTALSLSLKSGSGSRVLQGRGRRRLGAPVALQAAGQFKVSAHVKCRRQRRGVTSLSGAAASPTVALSMPPATELPGGATGHGPPGR